MFTYLSNNLNIPYTLRSHGKAHTSAALNVMCCIFWSVRLSYLNVFLLKSDICMLMFTIMQKGNFIPINTCIFFILVRALLLFIANLIFKVLYRICICTLYLTANMLCLYFLNVSVSSDGPSFNCLIKYYDVYTQGFPMASIDCR